MLNTKEAVLVIVDFQTRLIEVVDRGERVISEITQIIKGCQALEIPILATVQVPEKLGPMPDELAEVLGDVTPYTKTVFSALREPTFLTALRQTGRTQVILVGVETHVCIMQTGLDLIDAGYSLYVLRDGVFSRTAENHQVGVQRLHDAGATISSVEMSLFELIRTSTHPQFRTISKLVK